MIIIPQHSAGPKKPQTQHDTTVGFLVVFVIVLGIALVFFIAGPRSHNPPPPAAGFVVSGIALVFGLLAFFSWMKEQSEEPSRGRDPDQES